MADCHTILSTTESWFKKQYIIHQKYPLNIQKIMENVITFGLLVWHTNLHSQ